MKTKLKVGDKLPEISERLSYRCPFWSEGHTSSAYFDSGVYIILGVEDNSYRFDAEGEYKNNSNFLVKIEDVDKHIMETTTAPKTFAITGSKSLLKAMEEELVGVGYIVGSTIYRETSSFLGHDSPSPKTKKAFKEIYYPESSFTVPRDVTFQLPLQWDECLAFCKEQLELWDKPRYKVGDWIVVKGTHETVREITEILKQNNEEFEWRQRGSNGDHAWSIKNIRLATKEEIEKATKIEVGSWVICIKKPMEGASLCVGKLYEVIKEHKLELDNGYCITGGVDFTHCFRLATPEEIEATQTVKIGNYKTEKAGNIIKFGCQSFNKEELEAYKKLLNDNINAKIEISGTTITKNILNRLINKL